MIINRRQLKETLLKLFRVFRELYRVIRGRCVRCGYIAGFRHGAFCKWLHVPRCIYRGP